jgi:hypothetical protein
VHFQEHEKIDELASQWDNMLAHQLSSLPPLESFWNDIQPFFDWIEEEPHLNHQAIMEKN